MKKFLYIIALVLFTLSYTSSTAQISSGLEFKLQKLMDDAAEAGNDGLGAAIIFPDGCTWESTSGNAFPNQEVSPSLRWDFASNAKMMTAVVLLQMHEEGKLSIYDSIGTYINSLDYQYLDGSQTLHQFMTHTTNVTNSYTPDPRSALWDSIWADRSKIWDPAESIKAPFAQPTTPNPNRVHRYIGHNNYIFLGEVIKAVSSNTLQDEFDERLFTPFGLSRTSLATNGFSMDSLNGVYNDNNSVGGWNHNSYLSSKGASGALISSPMDIAQFLWALHHGDIISDSSLAIMTTITPGAPTYAPGMCLSYLASYYGAGSNVLFASKQNSNDTIIAYGHGGIGLGVASSFYIKSLDLSFVLINNDFKSLGRSTKLYTDMICLLMEEIENDPCGLASIEQVALSIGISPNPGTTQISINLPQTINSGTIEVYNTTGVQIHSANISRSQVEFDMVEAATGTYYIRISSPNEQIIKRWIKL